jgi:hypothetical protein
VLKTQIGTLKDQLALAQNLCIGGRCAEQVLTRCSTQESDIAEATCCLKMALSGEVR